MLVKKIKYTDYNGVEKEEDFYFNLNKAELMELEIGTEGGFGEKIKTIVDAKDNAQILNTFKKLVLMAYGVKSEDGKRFIKSDKLREEFQQTEAYSELFMELATNADAASAFINGIVPNMDELKKIAEKNK